MQCRIHTFSTGGMTKKKSCTPMAHQILGWKTTVHSRLFNDTVICPPGTRDHIPNKSRSEPETFRFLTTSTDPSFWRISRGLVNCSFFRLPWAGDDGLFLLDADADVDNKGEFLSLPCSLTLRTDAGTYSPRS
jgi:hypothetical protein